MSRRWASIVPSTARSPIRCDPAAASRPPRRKHLTGRCRLVVDGGRSVPPETGHGTPSDRAPPSQRRPVVRGALRARRLWRRVRRGRGGHSRERVLPLALAGLAALGHRGAFGADGESSDGAGVALPLDGSILRLIAGDATAAERPAVVSLFLPAAAAAGRRAVRSSKGPSPRPVSRSSPGAGPGRRHRAGRRCCRIAAGVRACDRRLGRRVARTTRARSPTPPSSVAWSSRVADSRPPRARPAGRSPSCRCRRRRRGRSSTRGWSSGAASPTSTRTCASR